MLAWARSRRRGGPLRHGVHRDLRCRSCFKHLSREHVRVVEMSTPDRTVGGSRGKDDAAMAHKGARSGVRCATLRGRDDMVESLRVLTRAKASALKARKAAIEQIRSLIVSASDPALAARIALEALSGRYQDLDAAIGAILEEKCVGSQVVVQLMISVGDNPERLKERVVVCDACAGWQRVLCRRGSRHSTDSTGALAGQRTVRYTSLRQEGCG